MQGPEEMMTGKVCSIEYRTLESSLLSLSLMVTVVGHGMHASLLLVVVELVPTFSFYFLNYCQ